jgi:hypothetical protein
MLSLAVAGSELFAATSLREISSDFWLRLGIGVVAIIVAVVLLRKLAKVNRVILVVVAFVALTIIGFNWIYERNEPAWATPAVKWLAGFFPTKVP